MKRPRALLLAPPPEYDLAIGASECARPDLVSSAAGWLADALPAVPRRRRRGGWALGTSVVAASVFAASATGLLAWWLVRV